MGNEKRKIYECKDCNYSTKYKHVFADHVHIHTGEKPYKCSVCGKSFSRQTNCKRHEITHTGVKRYECDICAARFTEKGSLKKHMIIHTRVKPDIPDNVRKPIVKKIFQCSTCGKSFNRLTNCRRHELIHSGIKKFECDICSLRFTEKGSLKKHMRVHTRVKPDRSLRDSGEKIFHCSICGKSFSRQTNCKRHELTHTGLKRFECDICSVRFTEKGSLKKHMRVHTGEGLLDCTFCPRKFMQSSHLKVHLLTHTDFKPFKCPICAKGFFRKNNFESHLLVHEKNLSPAIAIENCNRKVLACKDCNYITLSKRDFTHHIRIHTGEKPYSCSVCGKSFIRENVCRRHELIHSREKQYECDICMVKFIRRDALWKHLRILHKEKFLFNCDFCSKRFVKSDQLKTHMKTHLEEKPSTCTLLESELMKVQTDEPVCCYLCKKVCSSIRALDLHRREHMSSGGIYKCPLCDRLYSLKHDVICHMRHQHACEEEDDEEALSCEIEKLFQCSVCKKRFSSEELSIWHEVCVHELVKVSKPVSTKNVSDSENSNESTEQSAFSLTSGSVVFIKEEPNVNNISSSLSMEEMTDDDDVCTKKNIYSNENSEQVTCSVSPDNVAFIKNETDVSNVCKGVFIKEETNMNKVSNNLFKGKANVNNISSRISMDAVTVKEEISNISDDTSDSETLDECTSQREKVVFAVMNEKNTCSLPPGNMVYIKEEIINSITSGLTLDGGISESISIDEFGTKEDPLYEGETNAGDG